MKSIYRTSLVLVTLALLTACEGGLLSKKQDTEPVSGPEETQMLLSGEIVDSSNTASTSSNTVSNGEPAGDFRMPSTAIRPNDPPPADSPRYLQEMREVSQALVQQDAGRLVGLPTGSFHGYPVYPATCNFYPDHSECELSDGEVVDESYLKGHVTLVKNADTFRLTCGTDICVDEQGAVIGRVSEDMKAWRDRNCQWVPENYGKMSCQWAEG